MTAKRNLLLLPILAVFLLALAIEAAGADAATSFPTTSDMHVSTDTGKGVEYMARVAKAGCGGEIEVREFRAGGWGSWQKLSCTHGFDRSLANPVVSVDRTTNRAYVAWMQTSISNSKKKSFIVYRATANRGRTWVTAKRLIRVPTNRVAAGIGMSADKGILWLGWQSLEEIGDAVPALNFAPFSAATGHQLHDSLLTVPSNRSGQASVRVEAGAGRVTMFWDIGSGPTKWRAATFRPGAGRHASIIKRGRVGTLGFKSLIRGDDGRVYEMLEKRLPAPTILRWNPERLRFEALATASSPSNAPLGQQGVGIGAGRDGSTYIAHLDFGDLFDSTDSSNWCLTLVGGTKPCDYTTAPQTGPTTLYVDHFSRDGALESTVGVPLPFGSWAIAGEKIAEFVDPNSGIESVTTLLDGRAQLTYVGGYQYAREALTPNSNYHLSVLVTGNLF